MSSTGTENQPAPQPNVQIVGQYIKDLSFENPSAPQGFNQPPELDMGIDLAAKPVGDDVFEVVLSMRVKASVEDKPVFILELSYASLVRLTAIPEEMVQRVLLIQAPHLMFPYARRVISDVVRDGGMPPLMIEPIDFAALYAAKMNQAGAAPAGNA